MVHITGIKEFPQVHLPLGWDGAQWPGSNTDCIILVYDPCTQ